MLELLSSWLLSLWVEQPSHAHTLRTTELSKWVDSTSPEALLQPQFVSDPVAIAAIQNHLDNLTSAGLGEAQQSVWIQSGRDVLGAHEGTTPLPAASLTKIATTLVALSTWGANHEFETQVEITGSIENGVLSGDLVIRGGGDPFLVWEEAIALGNALNQAGINVVNGDLVITGNFAMNFESDPWTAGRLLRQALNSGLWSSDALTQYKTMPAETPRPTVVINGAVRAIAPEDSNVLDTIPQTTPLIRHRSLPLAQILKRMNVYSNNAMAEMLADAVGGADELSRHAAELSGVPAAEIQLINGSGLGEDNQLSARAVCAMLMTIQGYLQPSDLDVADLFPVVGRDIGTLKGRNLPAHSAVKTGTLAVVSSLAGVIPTGDRDLVWFAVLNRGPNLDELRREQDTLLKALSAGWNIPTALPEAITPKTFPDEQTQLGNPTRNHVLTP
ncbi:MAG: D-alanyl-D-alanine carboxypeptidase [Elainellaceae cyanobacterium]